MNTKALLALVAVGTGIGLLYGTKKGKDVRNKFSDSAGELLKKLKKAEATVKQVKKAATA